STNENIDNDGLVVQSPTAFILSKNKKLASSKKPLIIGMIVGSLLIAAVVLALIFTGILSTSTTAPALEPKVAASDNAGTSNGSNDSDNNTVNTSNDAGNLQSVDTQPQVVNTDNKDANRKPAAAIDDSENESASEPAITYEDFREESQSTLYRETND